ncbi:MAG: hypothetical protein E6J26_07090 [Chloroflexi bacterium]|nr:MAG: hypothetical protein E6J26_07090 [Chloroflexota bacterium]
MENPRLWWTHDLADSNLYTVKVETFGDELLRTRLDVWEFKWGLRWFEMHDWLPYLNGHRLFLKGNNYPPGDTRIASMTRERYLHDFTLARDAHMNFMRIHAHIEKPELYDVADELGILLWQDFPLQWSYAREVLPQAERQVPYMVRGLYNHPSVAIWCMHNEPIHITDTKETGLIPILKGIWTSFGYSWDREVMDTRLKQIVQQWDPTRPVLRCSGKWPVPWRPDTDSHFYFGWYSPPEGPKRRFETLARLYPRTLQFVTEFGAQSFPNRASACKFMDSDIGKVDWNHLVERHHFQPNIMSVWYDWRKAKDLDDLIAMSQDYQIEINQYYIDRLRLYKYKPCGGFAAFMFHDSNPAVQWSLIDYWREPKQSYAHMQVALNPEYVFTLLAKDDYRVGETIHAPLYVVNDSLWDYPDVRVHAELLDVHDHSLWQSETMSATLEPDCSPKLVETVSFGAAQAGDHRLVLTMQYGDQALENHYRVRVR